jgi:uncharacterized protein YndB with AHSA1/START domain
MPVNIITVQQQLNAPVQVVWQALTNATQMKNWYFATEDFIAEPGFGFVMYGEKDGNYFPIHCCILEVVTNKRLSYSWKEESLGAATIVNFELLEIGPHTLLTLTHTGLKNTAPTLTHLAAARQMTGWENIIQQSLKDYVEEKAALL